MLIAFFFFFFVFSRPGRDDSWSPTILGLAKRDLLRDVLNVFGV